MHVVLWNVAAPPDIEIPLHPESLFQKSTGATLMPHLESLEPESPEIMDTTGRIIKNNKHRR